MGNGAISRLKALDWKDIGKWAVFGSAAGYVLGQLVWKPIANIVIASPAAKRALADARARWPGRKTNWDGIIGDDRHKKEKSDHNTGNAVDITVDPSVGCNGDALAEMALTDPRVTYVIWNKRINVRSRPGWQPYHKHPHDHHVHISIRADARDDARPWPWA